MLNEIDNETINTYIQKFTKDLNDMSVQLNKFLQEFTDSVRKEVQDKNHFISKLGGKLNKANKSIEELSAKEHKLVLSLHQELCENKILRNLIQSQSPMHYIETNLTKWIPITKEKPKEKGWYQCTVEVNNQQRYVVQLYWYPDEEKFIDNIRQNVVEFYTILNCWGYRLYDIGQDKTSSVIAWKPMEKPYMQGENK